MVDISIEIIGNAEEFFDNCEDQEMLGDMLKNLQGLLKKGYERYEKIKNKKCEYFTGNKCIITGGWKQTENSIRYCTKDYYLCNFRKGIVKLDVAAGEYTSGMETDDRPVEGKIWVNNLGKRFYCISDHSILCPTCSTELNVISFQFGIVCKNCNQVH